MDLWTPSVLSLLVYFALCVATVGLVMWIDAPYGRHQVDGWGPTVSARVGWIAMESPAVFVAAAFFLFAPTRSPIAWVFFGVWQLHYVQRTLIFPFLLRGADRRMPVLIAVLAFGYNVFNGWINMAWISSHSYDASWWSDPRFLFGLAIFAVGLVINWRSDAILRALRGPGDSGYKIPRGFLYEWVSCPNYLGEMLEWFGFALMTWSPAGLAFALYTVANLGPRALANHRWYQEKFPDYPAHRKALIPGVL